MRLLREGKPRVVDQREQYSRYPRKRHDHDFLMPRYNRKVTFSR